MSLSRLHDFRITRNITAILLYKSKHLNDTDACNIGASESSKRYPFLYLLFNDVIIRKKEMSGKKLEELNSAIKRFRMTTHELSKLTWAYHRWQISLFIISILLFILVVIFK